MKKIIMIVVALIILGTSTIISSKDKTKIIYITNPNNPLGTIINEEDARKLINSIRKDILIVFDEAYFEYVTSDDFPDIIGYMKEYENVCVLRTFSKAYGLASLRIGYIIGNEKVIDSLNKVKHFSKSVSESVNDFCQAVK